MSKETLEELKAIFENAPDDGMADEFFIYQGEVNYIDNHENGHQFKIWCEDEQQWVFSELVDGWQYIRGRRSLSDIKRTIELMEQVKASFEAYSRIESVKQRYNAENKQLKERVKCVRNETLSDLCHAIEPDGAINSEQGINTIRAIQRAIGRLINE